MKDTKTKEEKTTALARKRAKAIPDQQGAIECAQELAAVLEAIATGQATREQHLREVASGYDELLEFQGAKAKELHKRLESWAKKNREKQFGESSKITLGGHILRFTKSTGKVATAAGITQEQAADAIALDDDEEFAELYTATKTTLAKTMILAAFRSGLTDAWAKLAGHGVRVVTPEEFEFRPAFATKSEKGECK